MTIMLFRKITLTKVTRPSKTYLRISFQSTKSVHANVSSTSVTDRIQSLQQEATGLTSGVQLLADKSDFLSSPQRPDCPDRL
jgi:hypothetical protein